MDDIDRFLEEDLATEGDITSKTLFTTETANAIIIAKQPCIISGLTEATHVFQKTGAQLHNQVQEATHIPTNTTIATIHGPITAILTGERLALNFLGKMSGIATETNKLLTQCKKINPNIIIAATRKTTPGFRKYEKKAVQHGGGDPYRNGLYDAFMIKDNHIKHIGSLQQALKKITNNNPHHKPIIVEVENKNDALIAAKANVDIIMLDNLSPQQAQTLTQIIRNQNEHVQIEISGGITPDNITQYAAFADRISLGYLTHSTKTINFSLEII